MDLEEKLIPDNEDLNEYQKIAREIAREIDDFYSMPPKYRTKEQLSTVMNKAVYRLVNLGVLEIKEAEYDREN